MHVQTTISIYRSHRRLQLLRAVLCQPEQRVLDVRVGEALDERGAVLVQVDACEAKGG